MSEPTGSPSRRQSGVLFISHDAWRTGAPMVLLHFQRWLKTHTEIPFATILRSGAGNLRPDFEAVGPVLAWDELPAARNPAGPRSLPRSRVEMLDWIDRTGIGLIYSNTITNGEVLEALRDARLPVITHVHELEYWIRHRTNPLHIEQARRNTALFVAVSKAVRDNLTTNVGVPSDKVEVIPGFITPDVRTRKESPDALRLRLGIPRNAFVVGGSGTTDWRKGPDLFIQLAAQLRRRRPVEPVHFIWVGGENTGSEFAALWHDVLRTDVPGFVHFVGGQANPFDYFAAMDVFALTSREDPFPLVCLEAASLGKPIVCFDRAGGIPEFVRDDAGCIVPYLHLDAMASAVERLIDDSELRREYGRVASSRAEHEYAIDVIAPRLLAAVRRQMASGRGAARDQQAAAPAEPRAESSVQIVRDQRATQSVRAIAFYLPQFHPIPENDTWWGPGFTEWRNVAAGRPLFEGHAQPDLPADLGFYDLRLPETRDAQAELAREHGIHGFCYYHYWFSGRRLLARPFDEVLASGRPDFPFCLCWANENWTRAWDGHDHDVLIAQTYSHEDDRAHIQWLASAFRDPRYIRVDGRPLFLVYRISRLPNVKRTADIWREEAKRLGIGDIFLATVESLRDDRVDPTSIGFDGAVEFQPDWLSLGEPLVTFGAGNKVYSYLELVERALSKPVPPYSRFRCVATDWDNSARRRENVTTFVESTPEVYRRWLQAAVNLSAAESATPIVFINAWNEWAEGAHLEPNQRWGHGYLDATRSVLRGDADGSTRTIDTGPARPPRPFGDVRPGIPSMFEAQRRDREALAAALREVESLRRSMSWRLTRPLRSGYEVLLWLKRLAAGTS